MTSIDEAAGGRRRRQLAAVYEYTQVTDLAAVLGVRGAVCA